MLCTEEDTLLLRHLWFSDIGQKARMGSAALGVLHSCLHEAQFAVYGVADFAGVSVVLAIVLPPADWAQGE